MTWSGKDTLLAEFLPRFHDKTLAAESITAYLKKSRVYDDDRARAWLEKDLLRDQELAAIADPEDYALGPSRYDLNGCYHCYGRGFVRLDVDAHATDFGKARPCPACRGRDGDQSAHCTQCADFTAKQAAGAERNQCYKCRQFEDEPAGERCSNPKWHWPNWQGLPAAESQRDYVAELARQMKSA